VLVLAELAGQANKDGWFTTADVEAMFLEFRLPRPARVSSHLSNMRKPGLVINRTATKAARAGWSLTPAGRAHVLDVIGEIDAAKLAPELARLTGAELGHVQQTVLPPGLAPLEWQQEINSLLKRSPFANNVLGITRFQRKDKPDDPIQDVIDAVRQALKPHGLVLHLASERIVDDDLWSNVAAYMWACRYGIALVEDRVGEGVNDNLIIEVGGMHMAGRRCALLKDRTVPKMPTDLIGRIFKPVDFDDLSAVADEVHVWAAEDLDLGRCPACPKK
jgi:hypothetical protein